MRPFKSWLKPSDFALFRKRDILIYLFIATFTLATMYWVYTTSTGRVISVRINGVVRYRFSLDDEGIKRIENDGKQLMELVIDQSDVRIINSVCPRRLCEKGSLNQSGALVCVPSKVIVTFESEEAPVKDTDGIDLITG